MNHLKYKIIRGLLLKNKGFSLVEVLVGILILTLFTITALQALGIALINNVRSEEKDRATTWIDEQLEEIKFVASTCDGELNNCENSDDCGDALQTEITNANSGNEDNTVDVPDSVTLVGNREVTVERDLEIGGDPNTLEINYTATNTEGDEIAQIDTEVIPDAEFGSC